MKQYDEVHVVVSCSLISMAPNALIVQAGHGGG